MEQPYDSSPLLGAARRSRILASEQVIGEKMETPGYLRGDTNTWATRSRAEIEALGCDIGIETRVVDLEEDSRASFVFLLKAGQTTRGLALRSVQQTGHFLCPAGGQDDIKGHGACG